MNEVMLIEENKGGLDFQVKNLPNNACKASKFEVSLDTTSGSLHLNSLSVLNFGKYETQDTWGSPAAPGDFSNALTIGVQLHQGAADVDGPPTVLFCMNFPNYIGPPPSCVGLF